MELGSQRVWDYVGDGYVHRVVVDGSGKLVEVGPGLDEAGMSLVGRDEGGSVADGSEGGGLSGQTRSVERRNVGGKGDPHSAGALTDRGK
ncbi:hypothetical protein HDU93_003426, partial [Gonapodya sp. JEL0774]